MDILIRILSYHITFAEVNVLSLKMSEQNRDVIRVGFGGIKPSELCGRNCERKTDRMRRKCRNQHTSKHQAHEPQGGVRL